MSTGKPRDLQKEQQWRRLLAQRDAEQAAFIPVRLLAESDSPNGTLEVLLAGGRRLRVAKGFDAATLRQLLAVLEEERPC